MKNVSAHRFVAWLVVTVFLMFPIAANAVLPFKIKPGHPRLYLDSARVAAIRAAANVPTPLNGAAFPQKQGTLEIDIYPQLILDPTVCTHVNSNNPPSSCLTPVFDDYDRNRNHVFLRHLDCNEHQSNQMVLRFQVALQANNGDYVAVNNFSLSRNQWHTIRISWNSLNHIATLQIDGVPTIDLIWNQTNGVPAEWQPDGQKFHLSGRDLIDNVRVYSTDTPQSKALMADFSMNEGSGGVTKDISNNNRRLRISPGNTWTTRANGDYAIQMGTSAGIRVSAPSLLTEAWAASYGRALDVARTLNSGGDPLAPKSVANAHPMGIIEVATSLGMAWMVTSDAQFKTAAIVYANRLIDTPRSAGDYPREYFEGGRIGAMGVLYDWFFNAMGSTFRNDGNTYRVALAAAILETVRLPDLAGAICGGNQVSLGADWHCRTNNGNGDVAVPSPNYVDGHSFEDNTRITPALFAVYDEHPEIENLLNVEYQNFVSGYNPARAWTSVDGGHHMGWAYGAAYTALDAILLWESGSNVSLSEPWQGKLIDRDIYGLRGDFSFPASGDAFTYKLGNELGKSFALWGGKHFGNGFGMRFYNHWILPYGDAIGYHSSRLYELLLWEPGLPETPLENLDYSRWFRNAGNVLMRDSWNYPEATLIEFKSTSFYSLNHHHQDNNAFTLYYKAPLLVDSGYYDTYGSSHWHNYYVRSIAHNLVTVWDPTETFIRSWKDKYGNLLCCSNDGGQMVLPGQDGTLPDLMPSGARHLDGVTAYEYTPDYTYTVGNASKAYNSAKLDQTNGFIRYILYLRMPSFWRKSVTIVFDKVTASVAGAGLTKRFLLHTVNEPVPPRGSVLGPGLHTLKNVNTMEIRNGAGMLFSQTLLPVNPIITKIGGKDADKDFRFLAPSKTAASYVAGLVNYPPNPDPDASTTDSYVSADMGNWRIEITAPAPSQREYFLHVLSVADNDGTVTVPPRAQNLSTDSAAVVLLANTQTIVFNKGDFPAASLNWNTPVVDSKMIVVGLRPNASYSGNITRNGTGTNSYTIAIDQDQKGKLLASSQGVLTINSSLALLTSDRAVGLAAIPTRSTKAATSTMSSPSSTMATPPPRIPQ